MNAAARAFWVAYQSAHPALETKISATYAGSRDMTDELIQLYLEGKKHAASSLVADFQSAGDPLPALGDHWIVLSSTDEPAVLCRTIRVDICTFDEVRGEVAQAEGEGDLSLAHWRTEHGRFWTPYLEKFGVKDLNSAEVVTEFFEVFAIKTAPPSWRRIPQIVSTLF